MEIIPKAHNPLVLNVNRLWATYTYHLHLSQSTLIIFCFKIWKSELTFLCPNYKSKPFSHQLSHPLSTFIEVEVEVNRNLSESRLRIGIRSCWSSSSSEDKMTTNWYICKPSRTWLNFKFSWSFDCALGRKGDSTSTLPYATSSSTRTSYGTNMWTRS